ncbi:iron ABC transporter permease [Chlamydiia bacterium]|nr:iron ABC transporter permease [Chlamydiia bacterium]
MYLKKPSRFLFYTILFCLGLLSLIIGSIPFQTLIDQCYERLCTKHNIWCAIIDERLPRLIVLVLSGASLAVAGSVMQTVFNNPLASPSSLGISSGASLMVVLSFYFQWHQSDPKQLALVSIFGCVITLILVYLISRVRSRSLSFMLITGFAASSFFSAIADTISHTFHNNHETFLNWAQWHSATTFDRDWCHVEIQLPLTLIGLLGIFYLRKEIDIMSLGDDDAQTLGVNTDASRWIVLLLTSMITGASLAAMGGGLPFFGLLLPYLVRKCYGPGMNTLFPLCMGMGSISLVTLDLTIRFFEFESLAIGNVSALFGGSSFLLICFHEFKDSA